MKRDRDDPRYVKKGQILLLADDTPGSCFRQHARYGKLHHQLHTMIVGGHGWYSKIVLVKVVRVVDAYKAYGRIMRERSRTA